MASTAANPPASGHRRNKSAAVLKSIIIPQKHKRSPSDGTPLKKDQLHDISSNPDPAHAHAESSSKPPQSPVKTLHTKTKSTLSLRSLATARAKDRQSVDVSRAQQEDPPSASPKKPKKTKSSRNLAAMLGMNTKRGRDTATKDKENAAPTSPPAEPAPVHTPIWAEFSSQPFQELTTTSKVPLNDGGRRSVEDEIALYTPAHYSPSKQRNFADYGLPALQQRPQIKERPKSTFLPNTNTSLLDTFSRKKTSDRVPLADTKGNEGRPSTSRPPSRGIASRPQVKRSSTDIAKRKEDVPPASPKKQNRVMAAVAAFNGRSKDSHTAPGSPTKLNPQDVEAEFETVLESRNIPQHQRAAMRTLKLEVKADFVRTHKLDTPTVQSRAASGQSASADNGTKKSTDSGTKKSADSGGKKSSKSTWGKSNKSRDELEDEPRPSEDTADNGASSKRGRPLSKTFTFGKGDSPSKKQRPQPERKASSKTIPRPPSMRSLVSNGSTKSSKGTQASTPDDFITYMRTTQKVEDVEVGKLHKLRQLLRNETVEWVDTFVQEDGMIELVDLLHKIMEVEWREDHEDQLLHEVLRCLKGLCTTDSALKQLSDLASTLFPALLAMLFDEEHKGPSEFTTRELIVQLLFAHLSTAPDGELHSRATELLKYLKDPIKEKESSTVPFILQMHQPRPYQVWCKEITNVTKEVFWIFIHHLTVVPMPRPSSADGLPKPYEKTYFPGPRAIVPAAPYVGGVEWDATNYIASHLDLLNGVLASLPSREERNALRSELKVSGFEKLISHLRACNPKYYGAVHDAMKLWIAAACEDGWDVKLVRMGPSDGMPLSPMKSSPKKKNVEEAPKIEAPKMDYGKGLGLDMQFEKEIGGPVKTFDDWI